MPKIDSPNLDARADRRRNMSAKLGEAHDAILKASNALVDAGHAIVEAVERLGLEDAGQGEAGPTGIPQKAGSRASDEAQGTAHKIRRESPTLAPGTVPAAPRQPAPFDCRPMDVLARGIFRSPHPVKRKFMVSVHAGGGNSVVSEGRDGGLTRWPVELVGLSLAAMGERPRARGFRVVSWLGKWRQSVRAPGAARNGARGRRGN